MAEVVFFFFFFLLVLFSAHLSRQLHADVTFGPAGVVVDDDRLDLLLQTVVRVVEDLAAVAVGQEVP